MRERSGLIKTQSVLALVILIIWAISCGRSQEGRVAEVEGEVITQKQLRQTGGKEIHRLEEQLYNVKKQKLEELIGAVLLTKEAKKRGISIEGLLDQEVSSKILPVTDEEIRAFYEANKGRIPADLKQVREKIKEFLRNQRETAQKVLYLQSLRESVNVVSYLEPPRLYRADVPVFNAPFKGAKKAPVIIVKFEDFHCPFCKDVQKTFDQLLAKYDGRIRLVHKDMPIDSLHPSARKASEAARCAGEHGKFWGYHDMLYANAPKAAPEDLKSYARELGLEVAAFERCLSSGKFRLAVQKDVEEGAKLGITGTPTFFINGREVPGAQPLENFAAIIDEELAQARAGNATNGTQ